MQLPASVVIHRIPDAPTADPSIARCDSLETGGALAACPEPRFSLADADGLCDVAVEADQIRARLDAIGAAFQSVQDAHEPSSWNAPHLPLPLHAELELRSAAAWLSHATSRIQRSIQAIRGHLGQLENREKRLDEANKRLQDLANTDGLTGLVNHRQFQERLNEEIECALRYQRPLSLLMVDVDKFKSYNDRFGHQAGDAVLRTIASALLGASRLGDLPARYGGEEFAVILPSTDASSAIAAAERYRIAIESAPFGKRKVTASFGASTLSSDAQHAVALLGQADAALYRSKRTGRNCVTHYDSPTVPSVSAGRRVACSLQTALDLTDH